MNRTTLLIPALCGTIDETAITQALNLANQKDLKQWEEENIPYRMFENENALTKDEMDDKTFFTMMRDNNPAMFAYVSETINEGVRQGRMLKPREEENFMTMEKKGS